MFEAFKIAVAVQLRDMASAPMADLGRKFRRASGDIERVNAQIETLQTLMRIGLVSGGKGAAELGILRKTLREAEYNASKLNAQLFKTRNLMALGVGGLAMGGLGLYGLYRGVESAEDLESAKTQLRMLGISSQEMSDVVSSAFNNTQAVITSSVSRNIADLIDLRSAVGNVQDAVELLPLFTRVRSVAQAQDFEGFVPDTKSLAVATARAIDMFGKAQNIETFKQQAEMMARVMVKSRGMVNPEAYRFLGKYGATAARSYDDEFLYGYLPTLMEDYASKTGGGGGHGGVGAPLMSAYSSFVQGRMSKKAAISLSQLTMPLAPGQTGPAQSLYPGYDPSRESGLGVQQTGSLYRRDLFARNPYVWTRDVFTPALLKYFQNKEYMNPRTGERFRPYADVRSIDQIPKQKVATAIGELLPINRNALKMIESFVTKKAGFERDFALINMTKPLSELFAESLRDPRIAAAARSTQWDNLKSAVFENFVPLLVGANMAIAAAFQNMTRVMHEVPLAAEAVTGALFALFGLFAAGGALSLYQLAKPMLIAALAKGLIAIGTALGGLAIGKLLLVVTAVGAIAGTLIGLYNMFYGGPSPSSTALRASAPTPTPSSTVLRASAPTPTPTPRVRPTVAPPTPTPTPTPSTTARIDVYMDAQRVGYAVERSDYGRFATGNEDNLMTQFPTRSVVGVG